MTDHFDFEQQLMSCWNIVDDLKLLNEGILESDLTPDQISTIVMGMYEIYHLKFDKLFNMFSEHVSDHKSQ